MSGVTVVFMPEAPLDVMLEADVIQIDNLQLAKMPRARSWRIMGLGFVGGFMEPITESEMISRINDATAVSWIPDINGTTLVRGKGNTPS